MVSHARDERRPIQQLKQLATLYGVQTAYVDTAGKQCHASPESLLAALQALGAPIATFSDVATAYRARRQAIWCQGIEPAVVVSGQRGQLDLRLPMTQATGRLTAHLKLETGAQQRWIESLSQLATGPVAEVEGVSYVKLKLRLPEGLPIGYHHLVIDVPMGRFETTVIVSPRWSFCDANRDGEAWGVFLPLYALHSQHSWGCGDFSDLKELTRWVAGQGGQMVATLPLLATFLDEPFEPSPYVPASRLFWNELYIDVSQAPGWATCVEARNLSTAPAFRHALMRCHAATQVDYRQVMRLKRAVLACLARHFFKTGTEGSRAFERYRQCRQAAEHYAQFRAVGERLKLPWTEWPEKLRNGSIGPGDYEVDAWQYHMYVQWVADEQLSQVVQTGKKMGVNLYLDLPLGVHPQSYDVWRERALFAVGTAAGAPPDMFFTRGQNWGFPPLHPEAMRRQGYRYVRAYLQHLLKPTGILRIDHVMGLHRLFWIPDGMEAEQGVYVRYPDRELYAILKLEAHRHQVILVGENLGTVPKYIKQTMTKNRFHHMYVAQYEIHEETRATLPEVSQHTVASLNTHDMPPFAAYCQGLDIDDRLQQGLLNPESAGRERRQRHACLRALEKFLQAHGYLTALSIGPKSLFDACLAFLGASPADMVLINLEDLWLETQPQNFPGTSVERPNWQSRAQYALEEISQMPDVLTALETIRQSRKHKRV